MVSYDPYMPEIKTSPLAIYERMREERPVYYIERFDAWALTRFDDIWEVSADREHFSSTNGTSDITFLERKRAVMSSLASTDPPVHDQVRARLFPLFGPSAARRISPMVRGWATDYLDRHEASGRIDAVKELAQQIAVRVSCTIAGFPIDDADYLVDLVGRFFHRDREAQGMSETGRQARQEMFSYLEGLAHERRAEAGAPANAIEVLGRFWDPENADGRPYDAPFDAQWAAQHLTLLLIGATETFPKVFASALLRLWQHPDQRRLVCEDPSLIPAALTEVLRFDMPTQWLGRTVSKDHSFRGEAFRAGQPVLLIYPAANRDPREFENPDVFDVRRNPARILSFGHGIHRCLGAFMARLEGEVLLEEVLRRYPEYEVIEDELVRPVTEFVQGYSEFPISIR